MAPGVLTGTSGAFFDLHLVTDSPRNLALRPSRDQARGGSRFLGLRIVKDFPALEERAQFPGFQGKAPGEQYGCGNRASRADSFADLREEIPLQVVEIADQIVGVWLDGELVGLEIRDNCVYREPRFSGGPQLADVVGRDVHRRDLPA